MLEDYVRERRKKQDILLMTHIVIGYPNLDTSMAIVEEMVRAGVELIELQIPFSEPMADGPVILKANCIALEGGATVERCLRFAEQASREFDVPLLFMSYYNILFKYGVSAFVDRMSDIGVCGSIVPDLPPEEATTYLNTLDKRGLSPVFIFSPNTSEQRMHRIAESARGFVYCVARKGVTGLDTDFSEELNGYLARCRQATSLPLALGFGVKDRSDIDFLRGKVDIAVIGSQTIRLVDEHGVSAVRPFLQSLR